MTLTKGSKLGPYEIIDPLGAGGMGEVYRAKDTRLDREVAVKVLPSDLAANPEFKQRFEREAKTVSSLSHPHICALYDIGREDGIDYLVMELLEGETLAERLKRGALPAGQVQRFGIQIAEALDTAHRQGLVHRDLKPGNIMLTSSGAKLMDFGLAKPGTAPQGGSSLTAQPTQTTPLTAEGTLVGTFQYMSPEQIEGKEADARSDIFALGAVLYEMATGKRAFEGKSQISVMASILEKNPPSMSELVPMTPPALERLVKTCLAKDPEDRIQSAKDVKLQLEWVAEAGSKAGVPAAVAGRRKTGRRVVLSLLAVLALAGSGFGAWAWFSRTKAVVPPALAYVPPPPGTSFRFYGFGAGPVVVSPDGSKLAFSATDENGETKIWVRPLADGKARPLSGTEDGANPFWSADGRSLGFFADGKLKKVVVSTGTVQTLTDSACVIAGGAWNARNEILFAPECGKPFEEISASGGKPKPLAAFKPGTGSTPILGYTEPTFLPGGRACLYVAWSKNFGEAVRVTWLKSGKSRVVLKGARAPQYASGHLLYLRGGRIFARPFDPASAKLAGDPVPLGKAKTFSVSSDGVLAYQGGTSDAHLEWFDRSGNALGTIGGVAPWIAPALSPDGKRVLAVKQPQNSRAADLWSYPANGGVGTRLTFSPGNKGFAVWSPDGQSVAYAHFGKGVNGVALCTRPSDGSGSEKTLLKLAPDVVNAAVVDWSPDGKYLSFDRQGGSSNLHWSSWVLPLDGSKKPFQPAPVDAGQYDGMFSPDGRWYAYFSYETGRPEVFVVPFPGPGGKYQISQSGGWDVRWAGNDRLFYLTMGNRLMEADLKASGKSLQVESIKPLFKLDLPVASAPMYDVSSDGRRFIATVSADPAASRSITLLLNWPARLSRDSK
jgi:eukaryotic-like serine/threonine-protein kinase